MRLRPLLGALRGATLLAALSLLLSRFHAPIDGEHYFRQTHVASNIEKYVSGGISLRPSTYNVDAPIALFDFPAYEIGVAAAARGLGTPPLETARAVNLALFALSFLVLDALLARTRVRPVERLLALVFFAFAPANLYYLGTPLPDSLAVAASLVSLLAFVRWDQEGEGGPFLVCATAAVLSTLVKNPVYLPVATAILLTLLVRRGPKGLLAGPVLAFYALLALSVVAFKAYSNEVNHLPGFLSSEEAGQYFGELGQRTDPWTWRHVAQNLARATNPLVALLALGGLPRLAARHRPRAVLYLAWVAGCALTVFVFFSRFTFHDYYHLPLVFPVAFLAAHLLGWGRAILRRAAGRWVGVVALAGVVAGSLVLSVRGAEGFFAGRKPGQTTEPLQRAGEFLKAATDPRDFIVYVVDDHENWNPAYLYFAKRDGFNLHVHGLSRKALEAIRAADHPGHRRFFVFCPEAFLGLCATRLKAAPPAFAPSEDPGFLYELPAP